MGLFSSHYFIGFDFRTRLDYPVYIEEFSNLGAASMTYDVFLSVVILHLLFLLEFLELGINSTYYVWMWIYFALAIFFGGCSFGPLMFAHHEYLYQKYKKGEKGNRN